MILFTIINCIAIYYKTIILQYAFVELKYTFYRTIKYLQAFSEVHSHSAGINEAV